MNTYCNLGILAHSKLNRGPPSNLNVQKLAPVETF